MSLPFESLGGDGSVSATIPPVASEPTWRYTCALDPQHVDSVTFPPIAAAHAQTNYDEWLKYLADDEDPLGYVADWIRSTIEEIPCGVDLSRDVNEGGMTKDRVQPAMFTNWVGLENGSHVRFSEARTAMHSPKTTPNGIQSGALRSPVMGGVALEVTSDPSSTDPRDAVTLAVYEFAREENANYPWLSPLPGRLFDFTPFTSTPYSVGPLFEGHPNPVTDPEAIDKSIKAAIHILRLTVEANFEGRQA